MRRIEEFKKSPEVLKTARFGAPPSTADMAQLSLEQGDLDAARQCRVGNCDLKLDARGIDKLRSVPATGDVMSALRAHLAEYAAAYLGQGNAALMTYNDHSRPATLLGQLERILKASPFIAREWPDVYSAIGGFSGKLPEGLQDFTYWSKEKVGPRQSVTLTHVIIRPPSNGVAVVASKQIYASHYATASLGFTVLVDQGNDAGPRTLLVYLNRTPVDMFGGLLGSVKRTLVRSRAKSGAERMVAGLRTRLEAQYRVQGKTIALSTRTCTAASAPPCNPFVRVIGYSALLVFSEVRVAFSTCSLPSRSTVIFTLVPGWSWAISLRRTLLSLTLSPLIAVITSPALTPAFAAGLPASTSPTSAPVVPLRPSDSARAGVMLWIVTPSLPRRTSPFSISCVMTLRAMFAGIEKPIPMLPPEGERICELMPISSPAVLTSAPPELPRLIDASV